MPVGLASALLIAAPIAAQAPGRPRFDLAARPTIAEQPFRAERGIRLPAIDYAERDGSPARSSGIIAGIDVAPGATFGLGLFSTRRSKSSLSADPRLDRSVRGGRKAAVGISVRF
jgi:hypothetical protein